MSIFIEFLNPLSKLIFLERKVSMGIISALLTGGTIVGKVCQALSSAISNADTLSNGSKIIDPNLIVGGARFIKSDDNNEHVMKTYLFNPTGSYISLAMPNLGDGEAIEYVVKPIDKLPIDECLAKNVSPDTSMMVGPISSPSAGQSDDVKDAAIKLSFNGLTLNGTVKSVAGFTFEATTTGLLVAGGVTALLGIVYFYFRGRRGVTAESLNNIPLKRKIDSSSNEVEYEASIDFEELGFDPGETFDEVKIFFSVQTDVLTLERRAIHSQPLTPAEMEYFKAKNILKQ